MLLLVLSELVAATPLPSPSVSPTAVGGPSPWLSDVALPLFVGLASVFVGYVAVRVASRSNALAADSTAAAQRSADLAERALEQEQRRREEDLALAERAQRRVLGERYLGFVDMLSAEMEADPEYWTRKRQEQDGNAIFGMAPILFEANVRGWTDFPDEHVVEILRSAEDAGGGLRRRMHARTAAHAIVQTWIERPGTLPSLIALVKRRTTEQMA